MKKKLVDENGRLFGRISVIDLGVIAVILVCAAALYTKFSAAPIVSPSVPMDTIEYQVFVTNVGQSRLDSLQVGDFLYDKDNDTGSHVGVITGIQVEDCVIPAMRQDGTYVMATADERFNVTLSITAVGKVDEDGRIFLNRTTEVGSGAVINYYTRACLFTGTVMEMG